MHFHVCLTPHECIWYCCGICQPPDGSSSVQSVNLTCGCVIPISENQCQMASLGTQKFFLLTVTHAWFSIYITDQSLVSVLAVTYGIITLLMCDDVYGERRGLQIYLDSSHWTSLDIQSWQLIMASRAVRQLRKTRNFKSACGSGDDDDGGGNEVSSVMGWYSGSSGWFSGSRSSSL